ncbi:hypothetical protein B0I35DRAFT_431316 [Stachybotrys elegans]|uniref:NAD(P)-binding protein n=1 Tax=Stachybotrys elegans TaxID=80388 RepID=A0A8K0SVR9_9HYPO|nr:hypothetical protein B0I35DRAFT_431316 [Stachybotrys elegans]
MASYLITGVSRGLGLEFLRQISEDPANTVFGILRNKAAAADNIKATVGDRSNIHLLQADMNDYDSLKATVDQVSSITGGKLDYLISNVAINNNFSAFDDIAGLGAKPEEFEQDLIDHFKVNVVGPIHLFNLYMPLVLNSPIKKVVNLTSGLIDTALTTQYNIQLCPSYAISKAAAHMAVAKFSARYADEGVLFFSISPGFVLTSQFEGATEEQVARTLQENSKYSIYAPWFKAPIPAADSISAMLETIHRAHVNSGLRGAAVSHRGDTKWL